MNKNGVRSNDASRNSSVSNLSNYSPSYMEKINIQVKELGKWSVWRAIFLGQLVSLLNTCTGVSSQILADKYRINIPTAQTFGNYVLLCLMFTTWLACRGGDAGITSALRHRGWKYAILAALDVEANYLVVKAYKYTTLTSITLLDCFSIPTVLALSWIFLKVRYKLMHIIGVSVCLVGVGCLVWADIEEGRGSVGGEDRLLGDMLCLAGATLYGISNVGQEYVVKNYSVVEFLGMLGLFGSIINGVQFIVLERDQLTGFDWTDWRVLGLLLMFAAAQFCFYALMPTIIRVTSATNVNLSLLTSDFFSLIAGIVIFNFKFHILYFLSVFLVICGIVIYSSKPTPLHVHSASYREMDVVDGAVAADVNTPATSVNDFTRSVSDTSSAPSYGTLGRGAVMLPRSHSIPERRYSSTLGRTGGWRAEQRYSGGGERPYRTLERGGGARVHWAAGCSPTQQQDRSLQQFSTFSAAAHPPLMRRSQPEGILKSSNSAQRRSTHSSQGSSFGGLEDVQC